MITYSTEIPIDFENNVNDIIKLAIAWITGSPFSKLKPEQFITDPQVGEYTVVSEEESATIAFVKSELSEMGGARYMRQEKGREWTTSIVVLKENNAAILSVQVACESFSTAPLPSARKPYFIRQVFSKLKTGFDGVIPISDRPFFMKDGEVQYVAGMLKGEARNRLPVVYLSTKYDGSYPVNPEKLARWISGVAHVVVEPGTKFSSELKKLVNYRNAFGGSIGVHWPESNARKIYPLNLIEGVDDFTIELEKDIRKALVNRRFRTDCNWLSLKEKLSHLRYEKLKNEGSVELNDFIQAFDNDIEIKERKLLEAEAEISRLTSELKRRNSNNLNGTVSLIKVGNEQNIYDGEIQDIVIQSLRDSLKNTINDSRKSHVLSDLIAANNYVGNADKLHEKIKGVLRNYREMDQKIRSALNTSGFTLTDDGKHYKAIFGGDDRYIFTISKTSSDHRAGMNLVSDISKKIF